MTLTKTFVPFSTLSDLQSSGESGSVVTSTSFGFELLNVTTFVSGRSFEKTAACMTCLSLSLEMFEKFRTPSGGMVMTAG